MPAAPTRRRSKRRPRLRFGPTAWAKLLFLRDRGPTEVGGFGIAPPVDLLYVEDIRLVQQTCTSISVRRPLDLPGADSHQKRDQMAYR